MIIEKPMIQSVIFFRSELISSVPRNAKENPATRALIKAPCLHISAKLSGVMFMESFTCQELKIAFFPNRADTYA